MTGGRPGWGWERCRSSGPSGGKTAVAGDGRVSRRLGGRTVAAFDRCCFSRTRGPIRWLQLDGVSRANARTEKIPQRHENFFMTVSLSHFASFGFRVEGGVRSGGFPTPTHTGGLKVPPPTTPALPGPSECDRGEEGDKNVPPPGGHVFKGVGVFIPPLTRGD